MIGLETVKQTEKLTGFLASRQKDRYRQIVGRKNKQKTRWIDRQMDRWRYNDEWTDTVLIG